MLRFLIVYFFLINIVTLITFGIDKRLAQQKRNRVQESSLILLSALGGAAGGLAAMYLFRHKTKHAKFFLGLPALLLIHLMIAFLIIF
ncbi:MAG: DUF1294 domain-containing protein [Bacteroidales bacterium]|nr:DUF1294 domain-containing protein [Bacteroidales bacterium]MBR5781744.1 DUF1294 domain-containing protein [Bacteroidales bacterium]